MLYRVFVEKKPGLDPESAKLLADCRTFLGLKSLTRLRVLNRYDLEGLDESLFRRVKGHRPLRASAGHRHGGAFRPGCRGHLGCGTPARAV